MSAVGKLAEIGIAAETEQAPVTAGPPSVASQLKNHNGLITGKMLGYNELVDLFLLSPPGETQRAFAKRVGYSEAWLSRIIISDSFQTRLAVRLEELEPEKREMFRLRAASIEDESRAMLKRSLELLADRLNDPAGVPDQLLIKSIEVNSRLLGYGARSDPPAPKVEMHLHLEQLATNLRKLNGAPVATDAEIVPAGASTVLPEGARSSGGPPVVAALKESQS